MARAALILFALILAAQASAQIYSITDLGTLGSVTSVAYGINNSGQVVGMSTLSTCESKTAAASSAYFELTCSSTPARLIE